MNAIKLNKIGNNALTNNERMDLRGGTGRVCTCSCCHANDGGSSVANNGGANYSLGSGGGHSLCGTAQIMIADM